MGGGRMFLRNSVTTCIYLCQRQQQRQQQFPPFAFAASQKRAWLYHRCLAARTKSAMALGSKNVEDGCFAHQTGKRTWKVHLFGGRMFLRNSVTTCTHLCHPKGAMEMERMFSASGIFLAKEVKGAMEMERMFSASGIFVAKEVTRCHPLFGKADEIESSQI